MTKACDEIVSFVAAGASREEVLRFRPSEGTMARVEHLVRKEKREGLLSDETSELDEYVWLEHLMRMVKSRACSLDQNERNLD